MGYLRRQEMLQVGASGFQGFMTEEKSSKKFAETQGVTFVLCLISEPCKSQKPGGWKSPAG